MYVAVPLALPPPPWVVVDVAFVVLVLVPADFEEELVADVTLLDVLLVVLEDYQVLVWRSTSMRYGQIAGHTAAPGRHWE